MIVTTEEFPRRDLLRSLRRGLVRIAFGVPCQPPKLLRNVVGNFLLLVTARYSGHVVSYRDLDVY